MSSRSLSGDLRQELVHGIRELIFAGDSYRGALAKCFDINDTAVSALGLMDARAELGLTELAEQLGITTSSTTALVDRLVADGYAERVAHRSDRRRVSVRLTPMGRSALMRSRQWIGDITAEIPEAHLNGLLEQLAIISSAFRRRADDMSR